MRDTALLLKTMTQAASFYERGMVNAEEFTCKLTDTLLYYDLLEPDLAAAVSALVPPRLRLQVRRYIDGVFAPGYLREFVCSGGPRTAEQQRAGDLYITAQEQAKVAPLRPFFQAVPDPPQHTGSRHKFCRHCGSSRAAALAACPWCTPLPVPGPRRKRSPSATVDLVLVTRSGREQEHPTEEEMRAAIAEMDATDRTHPSAWLVDEEGWTLHVYEKNHYGEVYPVRLGDPYEDIADRWLPADEVLEMALLFQQRRRDQIREKLTYDPWARPKSES